MRRQAAALPCWPPPLPAAAAGDDKAPSALQSLKLRLQRLSPFKTSQGDSLGVEACRLDGPGEEDKQQQRQQSGLSIHARSGQPAGAADRSCHAQLSSAFSSDEEEEDAEEEATAEQRQSVTEAAAAGLSEQGVPPVEAAALAAAAGEAAQQDAAPEALGMPERGSLSFSAHLPANPKQRPQPSVDLEAQRSLSGPHANRVAAAAAPHPKSSVFRRCCPCILPRLPWFGRSQQRRVEQTLEHSESFAEGYRGPDAAALFWFGKPSFAMKIVQVSVQAAFCSGGQGGQCSRQTAVAACAVLWWGMRLALASLNTNVLSSPPVRVRGELAVHRGGALLCLAGRQFFLGKIRLLGLPGPNDWCACFSACGAGSALCACTLVRRGPWRAAGASPPHALPLLPPCCSP